MLPSQPPDLESGRDRVRQLAQKGILTQEEAAKITEAIEYLERASLPLRCFARFVNAFTRPSQWILLKAQALTGRLDERRCIRSLRASGIYALSFSLAFSFAIMFTLDDLRWRTHAPTFAEFLCRAALSVSCALAFAALCFLLENRRIRKAVALWNPLGIAAPEQTIDPSRRYPIAPLAVLSIVVCAVIGVCVWWNLPEARLETVWSTPRSDDYGRSGAHLSAAYVDRDRDLIVAVEGEDIVRLNPVSGSQVWRIPLPAEGRMYSVAGRGDCLVVSGRGAIHRLDLSTGSVAWKKDLQLGQRRFGNPLLGSLSNTLLVEHEGTLFMLGQSDGELRWRQDVGKAEVVALCDVILVLHPQKTGYARSLSALRVADGTIAWEFPHLLRDSRLLKVTDSAIVTQLAEGPVVRVDTNTGVEKWRLMLSKDQYAQIFGDLLAYYPSSNTVALRDTSTGEDRSFLLPKGANALVGVTSRHLFVLWDLSWKGTRMSCVDRSDGRLLWTTSIPRLRACFGVGVDSLPAAFPEGFEERNGEVLVSLHGGTGMGFGSNRDFYRIDGYSETGTLLWTAPLPGRELWRRPPYVLCQEAELTLLKIPELAGR